MQSKLIKLITRLQFKDKNDLKRLSIVSIKTITIVMIKQKKFRLIQVQSRHKIINIEVQFYKNEIINIEVQFRMNKTTNNDFEK